MSKYLSLYPTDFIQIKCREEPKSNSSSGASENVGFDLVFEIIQNIFSRHFGFRDLIHEFGRIVHFHQFYWDLSHCFSGNMT